MQDGSSMISGIRLFARGRLHRLVLSPLNALAVANCEGVCVPDAPIRQRLHQTPEPGTGKILAATAATRSRLRVLRASVATRVSKSSWVFGSLLCLLLLLVGAAASAQQPAPGPGPIAPAAERQSPPAVSPPPEKPTEVPIGRLEGYEDEKRKAQESIGRPPGAVQEDPAVRRRGSETGSCDRR